MLNEEANDSNGWMAVNKVSRSIREFCGHHLFNGNKVSGQHHCCMAIMVTVAPGGKCARSMMASGEILLSVSGRVNNNGVVACRLC